MKKDIDEILTHAAHNDGIKAPDDYFAQFQAKMQASLPLQDFEKASTFTRERTRWQKIRPFVYMAAMFAGIWLMMNMFTLFSPSPQPISPETSPVLAQAMVNDDFVNDYCMDEGEMTEYDLMDDLYSSGQWEINDGEMIYNE